jgi:hypothetical protein
MYLDGLASCAELTTEDAEEASRSANGMRALFVWAARVGRPGEGAPKLLMAIARLARAEWIDGTPVVEISGTSTETVIAIFSDHGMGIRERVLPQAKIQVPVDEFGRAVRLAPQLIGPFRAQDRKGTIVLTPPEADVAPDSARESIAIDEKSLHEQERKTAPPPDGVPAPDPVPEAPSGTEPATTPPPADAAALASAEEVSGVHTHPTVRRMVAVRPEALRSGNDEAD